MKNDVRDRLWISGISEGLKRVKHVSSSGVSLFATYPRVLGSEKHDVTDAESKCLRRLEARSQQKIGCVNGELLRF